MMKTPEAILVRRIEAEDWELYRRLRLDALRLAPDAFGSRYEDAIKFSDDEWKQRASKFAEEKNSALFVAFTGGDAVGIVGGYVPDDEPLRMIQMWVDPKARGTGVADELVDSLKAWTFRKGIKRFFFP